MILPRSPLEFLRRSRTGEFGNTFCMWETREEVLEHGYTGLLWVPDRRPDFPPYCLDLHTSDLSEIPTEDLRYYYFVALPPRGSNRSFQFRLGQNDTEVWSLDYTFGQSPLRWYVKQKFGCRFNHVASAECLLLLKLALEEDWEWFSELLEKLGSNFVVEATRWEKPVGRFEKRLCLWEVRAY